MAIPSEPQEQHFVLRVMDPALADTLHAMLREEADVRSVDLRFDEPLQKDDGSPADHENVNRFGKLVIGGTKEYPVEVQALPTVVESYKTYDDINLVKMTDVGQVLVVKPKESLEASASGDGAGAPEKEEQPPAKPRFPGAGLAECKNGITPALQRARDRVFARYPEPVDPEVLTEVESQVLGMLQGKGLEDVQFIEEFYYVDEAGNGSWVSKSKYGELLRKKERQMQPVKKKGKAAAASAEAPDADVDMDDDDFA